MDNIVILIFFMDLILWCIYGWREYVRSFKFWVTLLAIISTGKYQWKKKVEKTYELSFTIAMVTPSHTAHIGSYRSILVRFTSYRFILANISSYCLILLHIGSYQFILVQIGSYWFISVHIGLYWLISVHIASYYFILVHIDSYWFMSVLIGLYRLYCFGLFYIVSYWLITSHHTNRTSLQQIFQKYELVCYHTNTNELLKSNAVANTFSILQKLT